MIKDPTKQSMVENGLSGFKEPQICISGETRIRIVETIPILSLTQVNVNKIYKMLTVGLQAIY